MFFIYSHEPFYSCIRCSCIAKGLYARSIPSLSASSACRNRDTVYFRVPLFFLREGLFFLPSGLRGGRNFSRVSLLNLPQHISVSPQPAHRHALQASEPSYRQDGENDVHSDPATIEQSDREYNHHDDRHPMR
ncbi:hypothetical protein LCGC14_0489310 [marine sediment metagenome]|uniref:Uncharacterized protein n=1 Tax=marine sediment metagenome TaxID=412755 RepID=A0A0F9SQA8_9ZZZZ